MSRGIRHRAVVPFLLGIALISGCSAGKARETYDPPRSSLLFAADRSDALAAQIGRSDWPATYGNIESPQETIFLEYYRDYQGHESLERNNPQRTFTSYRLGFQQR